MFSLAIFTGIYSYLILAIGLVGWLNKPVIILITFFYFLGIIIYARESLQTLSVFKQKLKISNVVYTIKQNKLITFSLLLLILLAIVNFIGALGQELAFDALWYHLTLPKIYLMDHAVHFIPGGLLYYSGMPQLTEMIYTAALAIDSEILAKIIHFLFGISACIALYKLARKFFDKKVSILAVLIFYSNLVVAWESTTAYIDLARTFFEIMALWGFINWKESKDKKWVIESAVMLGLAICTKTLAIGSLAIFAVLILFAGLHDKQPAKQIARNILLYFSIALLVAFPWFFLAFLNTNNPFYPLFTNYDLHQTIWMVLSPVRFVTSIWKLFTRSPDPLSPFYVIAFPLLFLQLLFSLKKHRRNSNFDLIVLYSILSIFVWYSTPQTGGGRFILPYLPALSLVAVSVLQYRKIVKTRLMESLLIGLILLIAVISIVYRAKANEKYLPVIIGRETKAQFMKEHLNFSYGDFYDIDGYFSHKIKQNQKVLLYGFHNLYYVDFPFIDSSWVKPGDRFVYVATQNMDVPPKRFRDWDLIYLNPKTRVKLYTYRYHEWIY